MISMTRNVRMARTIIKVALVVESHWVILERMAHCMGDVSKLYPNKYGFKASNFTVLERKVPKLQAISSVGQPN
jgi:hypothetical protein